MTDPYASTPSPGPEPVNEVSLPHDKPFETAPVTLSPGEIAQIWRRVEAGIQYRDQVFKPQHDEALRWWEGKHWPAGSEEAWGQLVINLIPNVIRSLVESFAFATPDFTLTPWSKAGADTQAVARAALRYFWREARVSPELKRVAYDSKLYGLGVAQVGWLFETEDTKLDAGRLEVLPPGMPLSGVAIAEELGLLDECECLDDFVEADDVIEDRFQVRRINPLDMVFAPNATAVPEDWAWVARIERRPLAEVKRDPQYRNTKGLKGSTELIDPYLSDDVRKLDEGSRPPDVKYVELVHYYERARRLHVVLARENKQKTLKTEKWGWASRRYPFRILANNPLPDRIYGKSVACELADQQLELNEARTQNMLHRRQFNRMLMAPQGTLDNKAKNLIARGEAGTVVEYMPNGQGALEPVPHAQLQPEVYKSYEWSIEGMEKLSGLSQYAMGNPPSKRMSANEANFIQNAHGVLFLADAGAFTKLCEEVAEDLLDWTQQYSQVVTEIPIFDAGDNIAAWSDFTGDEIRGDWLVTVNVNSTQPPDASSQLQDQQLTLQTLIEAMQLAQESGGQVPRPLAIVIRRMLEIIGVRDVDSLLPLPPVNTGPAFPPSGPGPAAAPGAPPSGPGPGGLPPFPPQAALPAPAALPAAPAGPSLDPNVLQQLIQQLPPEALAQILTGGS
jgi:hypothetical protein